MSQPIAELQDVETAPGFLMVDRNRRRLVLVHWLLIVVVGIGLRTYQLDRDCLWYDEVVTMRLARTVGPSRLIELLGQIDGTRAPLHPLVLQGWLRLFGHSELAGRSFSAFCGILTLLVVYRLGRLLGREATGRWATWLAAVCPPLVYYSREARMYAWLVLLTCLSWLVLARFRASAGWPLKLAYAALLIALGYSHPLGLFMVATHGAAYLLNRRSLALGVREWLAIQGVVLVAIAFWLPRYLDHGTDFPLPRYSVRYLLAVPIEFVGGNGLVLLGCMAIIGAGLLARSNDDRRFGGSAAGLMLLTWLVLPPVAMYVYSSLRQPIFGPPRYHLFIAPAYLILLARGLCVLPRPLRWGFALMGLCLSLWLIDANVYSQVPRADWRGLAQWIAIEQGAEANRASPSRPIVIVRPSDARFPRDQVEAARYYLEPECQVVAAGSSTAQELLARPRTTAPMVLEVDCLPTEQAHRPALLGRSRQVQGEFRSRFYGLEVRRRTAGGD